MRNTTTPSAAPPEAASDRFAVYRFFNGISAEGKEGIDQAKTRVPLVKTFLLEHVSSRSGRTPKKPTEIFSQLGAELWRIDDTFYGVRTSTSEGGNGKPSQATVGFLEQYDERFFAYYTSEDSQTARKRWGRWIQHPDLDATWFSSPLLQALWDGDVSKRGSDRFGKLVFRHESIFEMPEDFAEATPAEDESDDADAGRATEEDDDHVEPERRKARFEMGDRIGRISRSLGKLQENYEPLSVLHALRLPSRTARGGHDLYQTGQVTNRTDSFEDHRNTVRYLYRIYSSVLTFTEECAWPEMSAASSARPRVGSKGDPLIVRFSEPLSQSTFDRWVDLAFRKRNRFKLWGDPIRLGPTKVHVYGADRHLWQPINLELTAKGVVAVLPRGTCGNTFHRLVANIQHYVAPRIQAWIGDQPFDKVVNQWPKNAEVEA